MNNRGAGRLLRINLTLGEHREEEIAPGIMRKFLGSRGLNMYRIFREIPAGTDPMGPANKLVFGCGPLNGTLFPGSRYNVSARSPQTGLVGDSNAGGFFGAEMRFAVWDQIILEGKASEPVYVFVEDDRVQIRSAEHLWGLDTYDTQRRIVEEIGDPDVQVASIGPAAERGVRFAGIFNNLVRAAARTGMGTVMGAKNVKALAIRGHQPVVPADPKRFRTLMQEVDRYIYDHPEYESRRLLGTTRLLTSLNAMGILVTRHHTTGHFSAAERVSGERLAREFNTKNRACAACTAPCSRRYVIPGGEYAGLRSEGPEFEPLGAFTSRVMNDDLPLALEAIDRCNRYGMDALAVGEAISMMMELNERGIFTSEEAGLDLTWGNGDTILSLVDDIASRENLGALLSEGAARAAAKIGRGAEAYAMHIKGLELIQADPRGLKGYGLGFCVASRGGDHLRAEPFFELSEDAAEGKRRFGTEKAAFPGEFEGKGRLVRYFENWCAVIDSLNVCKNTAVCMEALPFAQAAKLVNAVRGWDMTADEMELVGERIIHIERAFCMREGIDRSHDRPPRRFLEEPLPDECGPSAGLIFELEPMLDEYYSARQWDIESGWPTRARFMALGLEEIAADLDAVGLNLPREDTKTDA